MYEQIKSLFQYYLENQNEILKKYNKKSVVIINSEIVGAFDSEFEAYQFAQEKFEPGTYIIQRVSPGQEAYTAVLSSNFTFKEA